MKRATVPSVLLGLGLLAVATILPDIVAPNSGIEPVGLAAPATAPSPNRDASDATSVATDDSLMRPEAVPPVASYTLRAKLDPTQHVVDGEGTIRFENASTVPKDDLYVHLYLNGFASDETVFGRRDGSGFRGTRGLSHFGHIEVERFFVREMGVDVWPENATTEGDPKDRTDIHVALPRSIAPGEVIHIDVHWKSTLPSVLLRTGFAGSFHMVAQWFPKIAKLEPDGQWAHFPFQRFSEFYADFGDYDVTMDVPRAFIVGATGQLSETHDEGDRRLVHYTAHAIHDFAFAAWDEFRERDLDADGIKLRCLFPPGYEASAEKELEAARRGLAFYGKELGAYPYENLTIVHPPDAAAEAGGMEYPTLITTGGPFWLAYSGTRAVELLTLHELAHQWFYGLVATNENAFPFLDEGLTTYAAGAAAEDLYGDYDLVDFLPVSVPAGERLYAKHPKDRAPIASRADDFRTGGDYAQLVYYRTATLLRTLDRVFPGVTRRALARYAREQRFAHPGPPELIRAFAAVGESASTDALSAALFDRAGIDLSVDHFGPGAREITVRREGTLALPVDVDLIDSRGARRRYVWDGRGRFATFESPEPIVSVEVDPEGKILLDENLLDNGATLAPTYAPRLFVGSLFAASLVTSEVVP